MLIMDVVFTNIYDPYSINITTQNKSSFDWSQGELCEKLDELLNRYQLKFNVSRKMKISSKSLKKKWKCLEAVE